MNYREEQDEVQKIRNRREQMEREQESKKLSALFERVIRQLDETERGGDRMVA